MMKKKAYLIGVKGVAMTALAVYLQEKGYEVVGSDVAEEFPTDSVLNKRKIEIRLGFSIKNVKEKYDLVIVTGAHGGMTNPEAVYAKELGMPVFMHGEFIGRLGEEKMLISVAGCHGKTTTSSIIAALMKFLKLDPSYAIGTSEIMGVGEAGHFGRGKYMILEADEYMTCPITCSKPRFLWQKPNILVITNIEYDHPDAYQNIDMVKAAYLNLINQVQDDGVVIACIDNQNIKDVLKESGKRVITYGFSAQADYRINSFSFQNGASFMRINNKDIELGETMMRIPGKHNLLNGLAASVVAHEIGLDWKTIQINLKRYTGCKRRFERLGFFKEVCFYDDYAHHPSEIKATLKSTREWFPNKKIITVFQPHTFSRTKALFKDFSMSFYDADEVIITDIYSSAREKPDKTVSSKQLVLEINKHKNNAKYQKDKSDVLNYLSSTLRDGDFLLTMGAGDIYTWQRDIIKMLDKRV